MSAPTARIRLATGFTILELLVVVSIASILSVLLLAALREARSTARLTQCMTNVKNLGAGLHSFSNRNKSYGMPGPPNAHCSGNMADSRASQREGTGHRSPNTLWVSTPLPGTSLNMDGTIQTSGQGIIRPPPPLPPQSKPTRYINHGMLYRDGDINDERTFSCPDMTGLWTGDETDPNGFRNTVKPYRANSDPFGQALSPAPATELAWMSSYDYRSCYDPGASIYTPYSNSGSSGDRPIDFRGPYYLINLGQQAAETAVFADTIQNPGAGGVHLKQAHNNTRHNVVYADGHGTTFIDDNRASIFRNPIVVTGTHGGTATLPAYGRNSPVFSGRPISTINSMAISIGDSWFNDSYWRWNERVWNQLFSAPNQ